VSFVPDSHIPDGQIHTTTESIFYDVSGVHILALSHLISAIPSSAIAAREAAKHTKYDGYAKEMEAKLVPFVLDRFGSLGKEAASLVETVAAESDNPGLTPSLTRTSPALFLAELSAEWQIGNAEIFKQWLKLSRQALLS
jgi:hypothetical protein